MSTYIQERPQQNPRLARRRVGLSKFQELKTLLHRRCINKLDLPKLESADQPTRKNAIRKVMDEFLADENAPLNGQERDVLLVEVFNELFGLGPLETLLEDKTISDILVNGYNQVYIERHGKLTLAEAAFKDDDHLLQIIDRIVSRVGRRIDESSPMVDARLPTVRASTRSFRRSRSTARRSRSAASAPTR